MRNESAAARHDVWQAGDGYENYMGRWSRLAAPRFLDWLGAKPGLRWLDVGCGTGALTAAILAQREPTSLISIDASDGFIAAARAKVSDSRAEFRVGDAQNLPLDTNSRDVIVSALMLNFVPDRPKALAEMRRVVRPGGTVGFYVWDYPQGGVEFMHAFWVAAMRLDPSAAELAENRRFSFCTIDSFTELTREAGFKHVESTSIVVPTVFRDFEDLWLPFTRGAGPAPGYCASLAPEARQSLKEELRESLAIREDGSIALTARALAFKGIAP